MGRFSAASGRGLIEADFVPMSAITDHGFSAASGRGLIEAEKIVVAPESGIERFSAASGRGLIEAT